MPFNFGNRPIVAVTENHLHYRFHVGSYENPPFAKAVAVDENVLDGVIFEVTDGEGGFVGRVAGEGNMIAAVCMVYDGIFND